MNDYADALAELRLTVHDAGKRQAWLTHAQARAVLARLEEHVCETCGEVCEGELVARFCEDCAVISRGSR